MTRVSAKIFRRLSTILENAYTKAESGFPTACFLNSDYFVSSRPKLFGGSIHAEVKLVENLHHKIKDKKSVDIFIFKFSKVNTPQNAKPCKSCIDHLKTKNIDKVYYTTGLDDEIFMCEKITKITNSPSTYFLLLEAFNSKPVSPKLHHTPRYNSCVIKGIELSGELRQIFNRKVIELRTST
jgi:hypothetical protein